MEVSVEVGGFVLGVSFFCVFSFVFFKFFFGCGLGVVVSFLRCVLLYSFDV